MQCSFNKWMLSENAPRETRENSGGNERLRNVQNQISVRRMTEGRRMMGRNGREKW